MPIHYVKGDATRPAADPHGSILAHVCNDSGGWGRGFVLAVSKRWPEPEKAYRLWHRLGVLESPSSGYDDEKFELGGVQYVPVEERAIWVANMIAQHAYGEDGKPPIRYEALETCLGKVGYEARKTGQGVHMPRIGCGLGGGSWKEVEPVLERTMQEVEVYVYDMA
jgi:O-acetyl-ADP-ribose deacetylase (regulator of RNase III)